MAALAIVITFHINNKLSPLAWSRFWPCILSLVNLVCSNTYAQALLDALFESYLTSPEFYKSAYHYMSGLVLWPSENVGGLCWIGVAMFALWSQKLLRPLRLLEVCIEWVILCTVDLFLNWQCLLIYAQITRVIVLINCLHFLIFNYSFKWDA